MRPQPTEMGTLFRVTDGMRQLLNQIGICRETMPRQLYHEVCLSIQNSPGLIRGIHLGHRTSYENVIRRPSMYDELSHWA
jgi:hypothetical protein